MNKSDCLLKLKEIMDAPYEKMYPFEIEQQLGALFVETKQDDFEDLKQNLLWEIDLLNRVFGQKGIYKGSEVMEISNKWQYLLDNGEFKPFSNIPFCEWKKEALGYYKIRYDETTSNLSKARYAFAIMVFSSGKDKLEWMKKSADGWVKNAEKYIQDGVYNKEYYELAPFSYEFAIKLSLKFSQKDIARKVMDSLHNNVIKILDSGEERWYIEFLEVESRYFDEFDKIEAIKKESVDKLKKIINILEENFSKSTDKSRSNHFLRRHLEILPNYKTEDPYYLDKKIADSYIQESDIREDPLIKSTLLEDAIKYYKLMQSRHSGTPHKTEIDKKIEEISTKMTELGKKAKYSTFEHSITIKKEDIRKIIECLGKDNPFHSFLKYPHFIQNYENTIKSTLEIKKDYPLGFIVQHTISKEDLPIIKHTSEEEIFDFRTRRNLLIGIQIGCIMVKMSLDELKEQYKINPLEKSMDLIKNTKEIEDINNILERGFTYTFGEQKDPIAGLHILTPYFEEIIRRILVKKGKKDTVLESEKQKYFRKIELGALLTDKIVEEIIGKDLQKTLSVLLTDNDQMNLRNDLTHGLLTDNQIKEDLAIYSAYCFLKLITLLKEG